MLKIGMQDYYECPICGCDNRMEVTKCKMKEKAGFLNIFDASPYCIVYYELLCHDCKNEFSLKEEYKMRLVNEDLEKIEKKA